MSSGGKKFGASLRRASVTAVGNKQAAQLAREEAERVQAERVQQQAADEAMQSRRRKEMKREAGLLSEKLLHFCETMMRMGVALHLVEQLCEKIA